MKSNTQSTKNALTTTEQRLGMDTKNNVPAMDQQQQQQQQSLELSWDTILLTPDNFKSMRPPSLPKDSLKTKHSSIQDFILDHSRSQSNSKSSSFNIKKLESGTSTETTNIDLLELLAKKDKLNNSSQVDITTSSKVGTTINSSLSPSSPLKTPMKVERWAGAAFSNSPAPSSLPMPSFRSATTVDNNSQLPIKSKQDPTRLNFSPPKKLVEQPTKPEQQLPTKQPKINSNKKTRPLSPSKKQYVPKSQPVPMAQTNNSNDNNNGSSSSSSSSSSQQSSPSQSPPRQDLDQLTNHLKMMLNICSVQS